MSADEPVGTLAEEAAKLFAALQGWAENHEGSRTDADRGADTDSDRDADADREADAEADETADPARGHDASQCRWCPVCTLARMADRTSPEVRHHLSEAALALALAVRALVEEPRTDAPRGTPVDKIDVLEE